MAILVLLAIAAFGGGVIAGVRGNARAAFGLLAVCIACIAILGSSH